MNIYIGADYRGEELKKKIIGYLSSNYNVIDIGLKKDYTDAAFMVGEKVRDEEGTIGIVICGSGQGVCIAANKVKGIGCIRAASKQDAIFGRDHDLANVLALGSEVTTDFTEVCEIIDTFINTPASTLERRVKRIQQIRKYEEEN